MIIKKYAHAALSPTVYIMSEEDAMLDIVIFAIACVIAIAGNTYFFRKKIKSIEYIDEIYGLCFIQIVISIIVWATILAIIGKYSLLGMALCLFIESLAKCVYTRNKIKVDSKEYLTTDDKGCDKEEVKSHKGILHTGNIAYLLLLIALILYWGFPTTYMSAGRDPGVYIVEGIHIALSGNMQFLSDDFVNENYEEYNEVITLGYPGLYSVYDGTEESQPGDIEPQFMPAFPAALAVGYSLLGMEGLIRVNGMIAVASLLACYYCIRRMLGEKTALVTLCFMIMNPAQIWTARNTLSEMIAQLLIFAAIYYASLIWDVRKAKGYYVIGILLGIGQFVRVDALILGLGIFAWGILVEVTNREDAYKTRSVIMGYAMAMFAGNVYGWICHYRYFHDLWVMGSLRMISIANVLLLLLYIVVAAIMSRRGRDLFGLGQIVEGLRKRKTVVNVATAVIVVVLIAMYMAGRQIVNFNAIYGALYQFSWYTSFLLMVFTILGVRAYILYKQVKIVDLLFFAIGFSSLIIYIWSPSISSDHFWASRRWVLISIPTVCVMGSYGVVSLANSIKSKYSKMLTVVVLGIIMVYMGYQSRLFIGTVMMKDSSMQLEEIALQLEDDKIYLTDNADMASFLRYIYDKKVYLFNGNKEGLKKIIREGEISYIGTYNSRSVRDFGIERELMFRNKVEGTFVSSTIDEYPYMLFTWSIPTNVYKLTATESDTIPIFLDEDIFIMSCQYDDESIMADNSIQGLAFFDTFEDLPRGTYVFRTEYEVVKNIEEAEDSIPDKVCIEIVSGAGDVILASVDLPEGTGEAYIPFQVDADIETVVLRLVKEGKQTVFIKQIKLSKSQTEY